MTWRPVIGLEGIYEVSIGGEIRRVLAGYGARINRVLKPSTNTSGYLTVGLRSPAQRRIWKTVHSIVAAAFIGPRQDGKVINHIDGNKSNNRADNLEYMTRSENMKHAVETHLFVATRGTQRINAKITEQQVPEIIQAAQAETQGQVAKRFGIDRSTVSRIVNGKRWQHVSLRHRPEAK